MYDRVLREELFKVIRGVQKLYGSRPRYNIQGKCDISKECSWGYRGVQGRGRPVPGFVFKPLPVCSVNGQADGRGETGISMEYVCCLCVICEESREQAEASLEKWRALLVSRGMRISMNGMADGSSVTMPGNQLPKVEEFKYLGTMVKANGECGREVKKRVQAGWNVLRKVSGKHVTEKCWLS